MFQQITKLVPYRARKFVKRVLGYGGKEFNASKEYVLLVSEKPRFQGKTAIVTGGSGAIGRAISLRLALEGAKVFVAGRTKSKVQDVVDEIRVLGALAYPVLMDVTNPTSVEKAFQMIMNHEGTQSLDIVVNCAGGSSRDKAARLHEQSIDVIDNILSTNLRGSLLCSRQAAKYMVGQDSGRIINISSTVGIQGKEKFTDYAAAKAGIIGYTVSLALELGRHGITVNCVSPGYIQRGIFNEEKAEWLMRTNYLEKVGTLEEVASVVAFVASDDAGFITGQNIIVDGGRTLGLRGDRGDR